MENKNKNMFIGLIVLLVVVAAIVIWSMNTPAPVAVTDNGSTTNTATNSTTPAPVDSTEDTTAGSTDIGAPAASLSYTQALITYKNARLQIEANCQASPDKMTFKNNALMMVDNRSAIPHTVKVGTAFPIKAFGFKIVKLSSATLPATWLVDCDKSQNVSSILIEK
jgi:hypothetical protein